MRFIYLENSAHIHNIKWMHTYVVQFTIQLSIASISFNILSVYYRTTAENKSIPIIVGIMAKIHIALINGIINSDLK